MNNDEIKNEKNEFGNIKEPEQIKIQAADENTAKQDEDKKKKAKKLNKLYKKRFSEKAINKKLFKRIYIPADKDFINSFFVKSYDEKKKKDFFIFDNSKIENGSDIKRLNKIAKEIKKQKCRINIAAVLAASACVFGVLFFIFILRNYLAKKIIINASEAAFGAKCEASLVDLNLLNTRFQIKNYKVANKKEPMRNLFEIESVDLYFNLLELSRGKFVCENAAIEGITWNTPRQTSGALPPRKQKKVDRNAKKNPVVALIDEELNKVKKNISVDRGINSVKNELDPRLILQRELDKFQSQKLGKEISDTVPVLTDKWIKTTEEIKTETQKTIEVCKKLAAIDVNGIKDISDLQKLLQTVNLAAETGKKDFETAQKLTGQVKNDAALVEDFAKKAEAALRNDFKNVERLAGTIKSVNANTGKQIISDMMKLFIMKTLGVYYPYFDSLMSSMEKSQNKNEKKKNLTLKDKSKALERLPGSTMVFGKDSLPSFVMRNISLSTHHPEKEKFAISGAVKNVTNDSDKLDKPVSAELKTSHGKMNENISCTVDLRTRSKDFVYTDFSVNGFDLNIPSAGEGAPSLDGVLNTSGSVDVSKNREVIVKAKIEIKDSSLIVQEFEPYFIYEAYGRILKGIKNINLEMVLNVKNKNDFNLELNTDTDKQIAAALEKEFFNQVEIAKKKVVEEGTKWINEQKEIHKKEIAQFNSAAKQAEKIFNDILNYEKILERKKEEVERRIKNFAKEQIDKAKDDVKKSVDDAVNEAGKEINNMFQGLF